jgi:hypothetical protein
MTIIEPEMLEILSYLIMNGAILDEETEQRFYFHPEDSLDDDDENNNWDRRDELISEQKVKLYFELKQKRNLTPQEKYYIHEFNTSFKEMDDETHKNYDRIIKNMGKFNFKK